MHLLLSVTSLYPAALSKPEPNRKDYIKYIENNTWMYGNMKFIVLTRRYPCQHEKQISYFQASMY